MQVRNLDGIYTYAITVAMLSTIHTLGVATIMEGTSSGPDQTRRERDQGRQVPPMSGLLQVKAVQLKKQETCKENIVVVWALVIPCFTKENFSHVIEKIIKQKYIKPKYYFKFH